jgi:hypothetical protein
MRAGGKDAMDAQGLVMDEAATVEAGSKTGFLVSYEGDFSKTSQAQIQEDGLPHSGRCRNHASVRTYCSAIDSGG